MGPGIVNGTGSGFTRTVHTINESRFTDHKNAGYNKDTEKG